ncbi:MAG: oxidoreductase [Patescibacteria group bacterium]|nr:oxidoreductase [Patescibacteria group bacterium]
MSREAKILTAILVVVAGGMIGLFAIANKSPDTGPAPVGDKTKIIRDNSHKEGTGAIQLVEFGDYQCPACGAAYPNVKQVMKEYDGKVTLYFRNFPLTQIHKNAMTGAEAAEAAADQGKFWEMHDKLYEKQTDWSEESDPTTKLAGYAKDLGLDVDKFKKALSNEQFKNLIGQDTADANALNVQATPTFFINGTQYQGKNDYPSLRDAIEAQLSKK